jgi:hypothetical protein
MRRERLKQDLRAGRRDVSLLLSLVAATCAVMGAVIFVVAWRDEDVAVTVAMGALLLFLLVVAILGLRMSL